MLLLSKRICSSVVVIVVVVSLFGCAVDASHHGYNRGGCADDVQKDSKIMVRRVLTPLFVSFPTLVDSYGGLANHSIEFLLHEAI